MTLNETRLLTSLSLQADFSYKLFKLSLYNLYIDELRHLVVVMFKSCLFIAEHQLFISSNLIIASKITKVVFIHHEDLSHLIKLQNAFLMHQSE